MGTLHAGQVEGINDKLLVGMKERNGQPLSRPQGPKEPLDKCPAILGVVRQSDGTGVVEPQWRINAIRVVDQLAGFSMLQDCSKFRADCLAIVMTLFKVDEGLRKVGTAHPNGITKRTKTLAVDFQVWACSARHCLCFLRARN